MSKHCVYTLINDGELVYIGSTRDLKERVRKHKLDKTFDTCLVISYHENRKEAYEAEKCLIKFSHRFCFFPNLMNITNAEYFDQSRLKKSHGVFSQKDIKFIM